jgi:ferritin-like metal-binding protein YciE
MREFPEGRTDRPNIQVLKRKGKLACLFIAVIETTNLLIMSTSQTHKTGTASPKGKATKTAASKNKAMPSKEEEGKLKEFFHDEIKDIYWAEKKLVQTLPKLAKAATSEELRTAFTDHLEETKGHVSRLEQVFDLLGEKPQAKKCDAMEGITEEGASVIEDTDEGTATRDVALILAGQKAEHYEIATYGGLAQIAQTLGLDEIASLLESTLDEEKAADEKLTGIAEGSVNEEATHE